jgi:tripartite-type tricarboxylate transporter receptor subunit TctC
MRNVPTLTSLGYRQDLLGVWFGWMLPAGTPPDVVQTLTQALRQAARDGEVGRKLLPLGLVQDWDPQLASEIAKEYDTVLQVTGRLRK